MTVVYEGWARHALGLRVRDMRTGEIIHSPDTCPKCIELRRKSALAEMALPVVDIETYEGWALRSWKELREARFTPEQIAASDERVKEMVKHMITEAQIDHWFTYHAPESEADTEAYQRLREAGKVFAKVILELTPPSAEQSDAIRKIREAVWTANASRACKGH